MAWTVEQVQPRSGDLTTREKTGKAGAEGVFATAALVQPGELVLVPVRSGGAFDPAGCRCEDVTRARNLVALVDEHPGVWVLVTLTVNRAEWTNPESAYQRCNDRVREVMRAIDPSSGRLYVTAFEVQGKTGDGWPHWHALVRLPEGVSVEEAERRVRKAWRVRTPHGDPETGEVIEWSSESIGFSDVEEVRSREGAARYVAKYLTKPWEAVPSWMLESSLQLRKMRPSRSAFEWWERVGRHTVHRGSRRAALVPARRARPRRRLVDRMAGSGMRMGLFRSNGSKLQFVRVVEVASCHDSAVVLARMGAEVVRGGPFERMRWRISEGAAAALSKGHTRSVLWAIQERERWFRRCAIEAAWEEMQERRSSPAGDSGH